MMLCFSNIFINESVFEAGMRFVVHEHHATHLHWDLRLEMDNVLKSWAVPKEPPLEPGVRRLAIQVEDHDLDYIDFEGEITEGYGKGTVKIWDSGLYDLKLREKDKVELVFHGKKMKGAYALVKFKKAGEKDWLLMKVKP
jgi:DNA ligase D-like protein (predicted 3'-phosphoesterase)